MELDLKWARNCVTTEESRTFRAVHINNDPVVYELVAATTGTTFQTKNAKFGNPDVTLSINDNIKFLENIKQKF